MPSLLEDPTTHIPPPTPNPSLSPISRTLRDNTRITLYPITTGPDSLPSSLLHYLHREFSEEILKGCTYPMESPLEYDLYRTYWFGTFAVVAVVDDGEGDGNGLREGRDWERVCLGTFYVKPNYPGRCSHVCNAGFFTTPAARNRGVGRVMGEVYLEVAPKLGYKYSVFNLVFENNVASVKIWENLGFQVIGRVPGAARLANSPDLVDALIIGKSLV
ncbi:GNAT family N-acetyltransferase [Aspergillus neoniger CBS 115656]|uniref:GNAT family acetyltransferase n=1 Tax=Aspergillus neoniger (strain CBS 115656) TaxID=1448310 RepID=A0A318YSU2_ASPNB|nr:GNAT family acetyltransferase [Aspergillus neoniger CBS 115656]PYH37394.1 GNAT family acetyltransferase [Aspergillus neoniger CBS 115656]